MYVSTFSWLLLIQSFLNLQVLRTCIKSWKCLNFRRLKLLTMELAVLECLKVSNVILMYNGNYKGMGVTQK